jgi:hypothetical protein
MMHCLDRAIAPTVNPRIHCLYGCKKGTYPGNGWCETTLYTFGQPPDVNFTRGTLIRDAKGNLYGTTASGGSGPGNDSGTAFELSPPAKAGRPWTETVLYNFCSQPNCSDGSSDSWKPPAFSWTRIGL